MVKKVFLTAAVIILLLLLFLVVYRYVRSADSYKTDIHRNADLIIKVGVDDIIQTIAADFLTNPSYYFKFRTRSGRPESRTHAEQETGLKIPSNLFIYTIKNKAETSFFTTFKLKDGASFKQFAAQKLKVSELRMVNGLMVGNSKDGRLTVAHTSDRVAIGYSVNKGSVLDILMEILRGRNVINSDDERLQKLRKSRDHFTFVRDKEYGNLSFKDGAVFFEADIAFPSGMRVPSHVQHRVFSPQSSVKMWLNASFDERKLKPFKKSFWPIDSLFQHYKGYADLELRQPIVQQDSVISYSYNDDFEKVEQWNVVDRKVPGVYLSFKAEGQALLQHLKKQQPVQSQGTLNRKILPLYDWHTSATEDYLHLSTVATANFPIKYQSSAYFFSATIDFQKLRKEHQLNLVDQYISEMLSLDLKAKKINPGSFHLTGLVRFANQDVNALTQIIQLLN